jgi:hypothetical protein
MAAWDTFAAWTGSLRDHEREPLKELIRNTNEDLLAARSEEARERIVNELLREARETLKPLKK